MKLLDLMNVFTKMFKQMPDLYIDSSVMQIKGIIEVIEEKIKEGYNIIMLDASVIEFKRLLNYKKGNDIASENAKLFLALKENRKYSKHFIVVSEPLITGDRIQRVIEFLEHNPLNSTILWTSNKKMAEEAAKRGLKYEYLSPIKKQKKVERIGTLYQARYIGNELFLYNVDYKNQKRRDNQIWIQRDSTIFKDPEVGFLLKIGDKVMIATEIYDSVTARSYISFVCYIIVALEQINNIKVEFNYRFYDINEHKKLKNHIFIDFLEEFIQIKGLKDRLLNSISKAQKRVLLNPD